MAINDTLIDALGGLFGVKVYKNSTAFSIPLNFEKYANISLSAGQLKEEVSSETKENYLEIKGVPNIRYDENYKVQIEKKGMKKVLKLLMKTLNIKIYWKNTKIVKWRLKLNI